MTETQERFLQAIAARVPVDRVAELHLFPSLRQGPLESGVAVVAVEIPVPDSADGEPPPPLDANARLTIYTAHYRLTLKGPDRGRWETGVAVEADAPLVTLDAVVRGVRHRAGDGAETERLSGDEFRASLAGAALGGPPPAAWTATR